MNRLACAELCLRIERYEAHARLDVYAIRTLKRHMRSVAKARAQLAQLIGGVP